ncbi:MAG: SpoIID/LytB domain-containing protein [Thermoanaerobacteraceae bacterium]|nr:SpoIID/LytB domain-containing protein [Thermoanaerobacteraceae bacterium]
MKNLVVLFVTVVFLILTTAFSGTVAAGDLETIRVGLTSAPVTEAKAQVVGGSYQLVDGATNLPIALVKQGQTVTVTKAGLNVKVYLNGRPLETPYDGPVILLASGKTLDLFRFNNTTYRGDLIVENQPGGVLPINQVFLEHYLYGVVGQEMGNQAHMEALKAQAVVSRSYALAMKQARASVDVGVDTATQVYRGYDAERQPYADRVKRAVDETAGEVIKYDGQVIKAFFHSNAGGYTESSENVWLQELPYIKAVPSPHDEYAAEFQPQVEGWPGITYAWEKTLTREDLYSLIARWNKEAEQNEKLNTINVGSIKDLQISRLQRNGSGQTASGRVTRLTIYGDRGTAVVYRDRIRKLLDLRSTLFDMKFDSSVAVLDGSGNKVQVNSLSGMKAVGYDMQPGEINGESSSVYLAGQTSVRAVPKQFTRVTITGKGYGHGLGMSQWGARGMANDGYNYRQIIQHYYNQGKDDGRLTIEKIY